MSAFLHNLRNGKYFREIGENYSKHSIEYEMKSIEYQNRGLPHVHIVLRLTNMPTKEDKENQLKWIKKYIDTCVPRERNVNYSVKRRDLVKQHMLHKCSNASNGCLKNGKCSRGYDSLVTNGGK